MTPLTLRALRSGTPVHEAPGFLSAGLFPPGFGGLALPDRIVLSSRLENLHPADREHLIWHELIHVEQMRQEGTLKFAVVYATDWVRGRWNGCGSFPAYEAIRYERQADLYADAMGVVEWARRFPTTPRAARHHPSSQPDRTAVAGKDAANGYVDRIMRLGIDDTTELARIVDELLAAGFG